MYGSAEVLCILERMDEFFVISMLFVFACVLFSFIVLQNRLFLPSFAIYDQ